MNYGYYDMMTSTLSQSDLRLIIQQHEADWDDALDDLGDHDEYDGEAILMHLGY